MQNVDQHVHLRIIYSVYVVSDADLEDEENL